ncbi:MAG: gamma-glutamylcyclotransferase [Janthinobacterium lividum]
MLRTSDARVCPYPPLLGASALLSAAELAASLDATLAERADTDDFWVFGYGSLIWNPGLPLAESCRASVRGYHRGLYLWSRVNRGTVERPGLVLGLDRGGSCHGMALRVAADDRRASLDALWRREMAMGSYRPAWLPCYLADGRRVSALAFVMRRDAAAYAGRLAPEVVQAASSACGRYGSTLDYIVRTVEALRAAGIRDRGLELLAGRCK